MTDGSYDIGGVIVGVTATLSLGGIKSIVELPLAADELEALRSAAKVVVDQTEALSKLET
jgi:malate/lactate dehydrogenase